MTSMFLRVTMVIGLSMYQVVSANEDTCVVDICGLASNAPACPSGEGVVLLRDVLRSSDTAPILGSCTRAGVFGLLSKVCNARQQCQDHWMQQIRNQCCRMRRGALVLDKVEVTYSCIQESVIYDVCASHRHPVPDFHRHVLSPNFTDENSRRNTIQLPFCQWSIPIPEGNTFKLTVNDLYIGPRTSCESETSFRLQYMDSSGSYQHIPSSVLCEAATSKLDSRGFSRNPIAVPDGSTKVVVWFTPVSPKERLWFSYQILDADHKDSPYRIAGVVDCGLNKYTPTTTTTAAVTTITSTFPFTTTEKSTVLALTQKPSTIPGSRVTHSGARTEETTWPLPTAKSTEKYILPPLCRSEGRATSERGSSRDLQRYVLIGALAGVSIIAVVFLITSIVLFVKLIGRPRARTNGVVRFIKADRPDTKPVVMEVECVSRASPNFRSAVATKRTDIFVGDCRDRAMSMHSSDSPVYAMPYKQPAIRYGSSRRNKTVQHVKIVEDPSLISDETAHVVRKATEKTAPPGEEDTLSMISGCTVSSSDVTVSDAETADLKELIRNLKDDAALIGSSLKPKASSVKVRAEMRRPRFPPDSGTEPVIRVPHHSVHGSLPLVADQYDNMRGIRASQDGGYELCRPFPVSSEDCLINPSYESVEQK